MARMLSVEDYGILAVLFSSIYLLAIFSETIQTVVTKYVVSAGNEDSEIKNIVVKSNRTIKRISFKLFTTYLFVGLLMSLLLHISFPLIFINGLVIFFILYLPIPRGVLQGRKKFGAMGFSIIIEAFTKLIVSVLLVYFGLRVYGAIIGGIIASMVALAFSFAPITNIMRSVERPAKTSSIYTYAKPLFFITSIIILFYSVDIIFVKWLFSPDIAGTYSIASILSKTVLWFSVPLSKALFPISAEKEKSSNIKNNCNLFVTLSLYFAIVIFILLIYYYFPDKIISLFSGKHLPIASKLLFKLTLCFSLIGFSQIIALYKISSRDIKKYWFMLIPIILEFILLGIFFVRDVTTFTNGFLISSVTLLMVTLFLR